MFVAADINECDTNNGGCEGTCTDNGGGYECSCGDGYELSNNNHSCIGMLLILNIL